MPSAVPTVVLTIRQPKVLMTVLQVLPLPTHCQSSIISTINITILGSALKLLEVVPKLVRVSENTDEDDNDDNESIEIMEGKQLEVDTDPEPEVDIQDNFAEDSMDSCEDVQDVKEEQIDIVENNIEQIYIEANDIICDTPARIKNVFSVEEEISDQFKEESSKPQKTSSSSSSDKRPIHSKKIFKQSNSPQRSHKPKTQKSYNESKFDELSQKKSKETNSFQRPSKSTSQNYDKLPYKEPILQAKLLHHTGSCHLCPFVPSAPSRKALYGHIGAQHFRYCPSKLEPSTHIWVKMSRKNNGLIDVLFSQSL